MEPTEHRSSAIVPSIDQNALDSLQFNEEIQHLMTVPPDNANSFTALLELPASQAVELLHQHPPESNDSAAKLTVKADGRHHHTLFHFNPGAKLTFPSNSALIERAAKFSVFAGEHNNNDNMKNKSSTDNNNNNNNYTPETTVSLPSNASRNIGKMKNEPAESDSNNNINNDQNSSQPLDIKTENWNQNHRTAKRKEREKRGKAATKKSKTGANDSSEDAEKLPYVHVRARRGQATDSHSLAERARREKINARMKLLQELVPGCNKISGTALVLDEIINHVQSLQRQVEFLSMRLAAVNPRIDFNLDSIMAAEGEALMDNNFPGMIMPVMWPEVPADGNRQQWHNFDGHQQQAVWGREEESHNYVTPEKSVMSYNSSGNSASLHLNQLKMEL